MKKNSEILYITLICIEAIIWVFLGFKTALIVFGIFNFLMFLNVCLTNIMNIIMVKDKCVDTLIWRIVLLTLSSVSLGIGICL